MRELKDSLSKGLRVAWGAVAGTPRPAVRTCARCNRAPKDDLPRIASKAPRRSGQVMVLEAQWRLSVARWKGPPERWFCQQHGATGFAINGTTGLPLMGPPGVASTLSVVWPLYWRHDVSGVIDDRSERDPAAVAGWPVAAGREQAGGGGP